MESIEPKEQGKYPKAFRAEAVRLRAALLAVQARIEDLPKLEFDPMETLLPNGVGHSAKPQQLLSAGESVLGRYNELCHRSKGSIAIAVRAIEGTLGWEPIPAHTE